MLLGCKRPTQKLHPQNAQAVPSKLQGTLCAPGLASYLDKRCYDDCHVTLMRGNVLLKEGVEVEHKQPEAGANSSGSTFAC